MKYNSIFTLYSMSLGFFVGVLSALFLIIVHFLINFVWEVLPSQMEENHLYPLVVGIIGGILVGLIQKYIGPYPRTMHETMHEFKETEKINYNSGMLANFLSALVVLAFGASLGPEAALASLLGGMISWIGDRMKFTLAKKEELIQLSGGAMLAGVFHAPLIGLSESMETDVRRMKFKKRWKKIIVYSLTAFLGFLGFFLTNRIFPSEPIFKIRLSSIDWDIRAFLLFFPALLLGSLFGYLFIWIECISNKLASLINRPLLLSILAGGAIGVLGIMSSLFLFSGEHEILLLTSLYEKYDFSFLLFLGIGKACLTNLCFSFGWRGGKIFPAIFSSTAVGLAALQAFPGMPELMIAVVVAASITVIFKQPFVTIALLLFLLPIQLLPLVCLTCWLTDKCDKKLQHSVVH